MHTSLYAIFFFFNDTATTEIYTLSLHDALPICPRCSSVTRSTCVACVRCVSLRYRSAAPAADTASGMPSRPKPSSDATAKCRSEEHTSELQSRQYLVCRLLLEKKK